MALITITADEGDLDDAIGSIMDVHYERCILDDCGCQEVYDRLKRALDEAVSEER
jgi:hypothetical protein